MTLIYSHDGAKKVDIDSAKLLGDVATDRKIYQQGDNSQLWRSAGGTYFKGMCLDNARGCGGVVDYCKFIPISEHQARLWVLDYYGPSALSRFGFSDDATLI